MPPFPSTAPQLVRRQLPVIHQLDIVTQADLMKARAPPGARAFINQFELSAKVLAEQQVELLAELLWDPLLVGPDC